MIPSPLRCTRNHQELGIKPPGFLGPKIFSFSKVCVKLLMIPKALLLTTMLVGILSEPQGPAYLPPTGPATRPGSGSNTGHPDEWAGDPANYEFEYEVQDSGAGLDFGHHETRKDDEATGTYHVLLPDGRTQIVDYVADGAGYRPMVRYEGTATYPAPGPSQGTNNEGYRY